MVFKKGNTPWNVGKKMSEATKQKIVKSIYDIQNIGEITN